MPRTRVHNLNISLDGYAAGEHVTFDAPIGGAERLFTWFDGRAIHGIDKVDAPVTLDRALTSMWGQGIGAEIMGRRKFGPQVGDWPDDGWPGLVGRRTTIPNTGVRPESPPAPDDCLSQWDELPVRGRIPARGASPSPGSRRWWRRPHRRRALDSASVSPGRPDRLHAPGDRADHPRARRIPLGGIKRRRRSLHGRVGHLA
jgi:hypothetical protein